MLNSFDLNHEICNCGHITIQEMTNIVNDYNINTLGELQSISDIGNGCMFCICEDGDFGKIKKKIYCKDVLNKLKEVKNG